MKRINQVPSEIQNVGQSGESYLKHKEKTNDGTTDNSVQPLEDNQNGKGSQEIKHLRIIVDPITVDNEVS